MGPHELVLVFVGILAGVAVTVMAYLGLRVASPWVRSTLAGGQVSLAQVIGMRLRGSPVQLLVDAHLSLLHGGIPATIQEVESKYLAHCGQVATAQDLVDLLLVSKRIDEGTSA